MFVAEEEGWRFERQEMKRGSDVKVAGWRIYKFTAFGGQQLGHPLRSGHPGGLDVNHEITVKDTDGDGAEAR